jgi:hypothetical protein
MKKSTLMKKSTPAKFGLIAICCCLGSLALPLAYGAGNVDKVEKREIVRQARAAYCSLRGHGLVAFQANVQPDWRALLKDIADPAKVDETVKILSKLHFSVSLDENGVVKVSHQSDASAETEKQFAASFAQMSTGMDQMMSGFFDSWKPFMLDSPFPAVDSDFQLEDKGNEYLITYKDGTADVETTLSKALVITELRVSDPTFRSWLKPQFKSSAQGFVLTGYDSSYVATTGGGNTLLTVQIENQEVSGQQLPSKLILNGSYEGSQFSVELAFRDYQVRTR